MLLHSRQKRKVICSWGFFGWASAEMLDGAGEAMVSSGCGEVRAVQVVASAYLLLLVRKSSVVVRVVLL